MFNLLVCGLSAISRMCFLAAHSRRIKSIALGAFVLLCVALAVNRTIRSEDLTIYELPVPALRATVVNHYVRINGKLLEDGTYTVHSTTAGLINISHALVPFLPDNMPAPVLLLDFNRASLVRDSESVTLVGKILRGDGELPDYYMQVTDPPSVTLSDSLVLLSVALVSIVTIFAVFTWLISRLDYAIAIPFVTNRDLFLTQEREKVPALLLWFGGLGSAYADIRLREVSVSFRAIPTEARLVPVNQNDGWAVVIHRARIVNLTTIATMYGALPAMRLQFEDERGITRDGLIAGSNRKVMESVLNVLRFVGQ